MPKCQNNNIFVETVIFNKFMYTQSYTLKHESFKYYILLALINVWLNHNQTLGCNL